MTDKLKERLKFLLNIRFSDSAQVLSPQEDPTDYLENTLVLKPTLSDYEQFGLDREAFIKSTKKLILKKINRRDPLIYIMAEKLADSLFQIEYLDKKFPEAIRVTGVSSASNRFVIELQYARTLLLQQVSTLSNGLGFLSDEIEEITFIRQNRTSGGESSDGTISTGKSVSSPESQEDSDSEEY